jgi:hypothetical protein
MSPARLTLPSEQDCWDGKSRQLKFLKESKKRRWQLLAAAIR